MARTKVTLKHGGMKELLNSSDIGDMLEKKMAPALAHAKAKAPVDTGAYRDGLHLERVHTDRVVVRIVGSTDHDLVVEADTGNLARALDSAR
jgi:hypothetical protein